MADHPDAFPKKFLFSLAGVAGLILLISTTIFFRVEVLSEMGVSTFLEILFWQGLSWAPWVLVIALGLLPVGGRLQTGMRRWNLPAHLLAAFAIASLNTLWFKTVSENISPFVGLENTRYGVFPWFFIFWFFLGLALYLGVVQYFGAGKAAQQKGEDTKARLVAKTGKVSEVIKPAEVLWIEAQDYYSVLHLAQKQSWIKMTMKELEEMLDKETFIRVHRSTIINVNHLKQIKTESPGKYSAVMKDGKVRPISRAGWRDLKKVLKTTK